MIAIPLAGCVITNEAGEVLLIHRSTPELTQWELPGGKLKPGESFSETAIREVKEELGIHVAVIKMLGHATFEEREFTWDYHWFAAEIIRGEVRVRERKFDDVKYVNLLTADADTLSPNARNLAAALQNGSIVL